MKSLWRIWTKFCGMIIFWYWSRISFPLFQHWENSYIKSDCSKGLLKTLQMNVHVFTCVSYAEARNRYRLDVCPSVTRWYCIKTAERIVMLSSPYDSAFILVLCVERSSRNSDGVTPCGAAKQRWGVKMSQFSTNNSLYLRNGWR